MKYIKEKLYGTVEELNIISFYTLKFEIKYFKLKKFTLILIYLSREVKVAALGKK